MAVGNNSLRGRVAIITGAGKGLGRAYAVQLASLGAKVVVNNRSDNDPPQHPSADRVVAEIRDAGGEAIASYDRVEEPDSGERLVRAALDHFGRLDIVLSNAGIDRARSFHKQQMADFEEVMAINFHAVARLLHAAWPHLRSAGYGRVLVSTSTAGLWGNHGQAAYAASKAALVGLVKSLAIEGAARGIGVNALAPYAVTQLTAPWFGQTGAERFSPEAVARLASWLVGEACPLNGEILISGAGHLRLARVMESPSLPVPEDCRDLAAALGETSCTAIPASATAEFEDFVQMLG